MFKYVIERLTEAGTWKGIVALITALGVVMTPDQQGAVIASGLAVMGMIGAFLPDTKAVVK